MSAEDFNKRQRQRRLETCAHFNGLFRNEACARGISYASVEDKAVPKGSGRVLPCLPPLMEGVTRSTTCVCVLRQLPSEADIDAEDQRFERSMQNTLKARAAIESVLGKWTKGSAGSGTMVCPICRAGTLRYSRSGYNGHIHAACGTGGCVGWME